MKDRSWIIDATPIKAQRNLVYWQVRYKMPGYPAVYRAYGATRFGALRAAAFARRSYILRDLTAKLTQ